MSVQFVELSELATIERNGVSPSQIEDGTLYVGLEHIEAGGRLLDVKPVASGELASTKFGFGAKHVLYGKLRPYLAKIATPDFRGICSTDILPILPGPKLDRSYLTHFLRQPAMVDYAASRSEGVNLPRLSPKTLAKFQIPLPPLDEQKRIAAILDKADQLRQKRRQAIALLDSLSQSIFLEMFGDPLSGSSLLSRAQLKDIAELINGDRSSNYPSQDELVDDGVLFLNTTNITDDGLDLEKCNFITTEKFRALGRGKLQSGDIVITLRGSLGQTAIFNCNYDTAFINAQMMIIRSGELVHQEYLLSLLKLDRMQKHFKKIGSGSAVPQLTAKQMGELQIPLPSKELQVEFSNRITHLRNKRRSFKHSGQVLESLFASLQHRAFSGQL